MIARWRGYIVLAWFLVVHRRRVTITPSLAVELPLQSRRPSSSRRALHHPQFAIARSIAAHHHCALGPLPLCLHHPLQSRSRFAVPRRQGAVAPSLAVKEPLRRPSLPSRSHCSVHCHQGAVAPYLAIKEPSAVSTDDSGHSSRPPPRPLVPMVVALPLLTPPPSICGHLSLRHRLLCLLQANRRRFRQPCGCGGAMRGTLTDKAQPGLHSKPMDAAIGLVLASHCRGGRHG